MTEMVDHHFMALHMATMCLEKAVHPQLRTLCWNIATSQAEEIELMQSWLASWYGVQYSPQMTHEHMNHMERMAALSPEEFEVEFMKMMIRHHWKAVIRGIQCIDKAYHDDLVALCESIVLAQSAEIEAMRSWLCQWYGLCNYGPKGAKGEDAVSE